MFLESPRFPDSISYGAVGGPEYSTDIAVLFSGFEQRNVNWTQSRAKYDVAHALKDVNLTNLLISFFRSMKGRGYSFRFKDWNDFSVTQSQGFIVKDALDPTKYRLTKLYSAGLLSETRIISKPVDGSVLTFKNGISQNYAYNPTTGFVTIPATPAILTTDVLTWSGEFDVPVRFDTDQMQVEAVGYDVNSWGSIPLVEVRV